MTDLASIPSGHGQILVIDPPWLFASNSANKPGRNARRHYDCMTDAEIQALPVRDWTAPDSLLFLWATAPGLEKAMAAAKAWGFRYKSQMVWVKGRTITGFWVRNRHELILIFRRGKFPCPWPPAPFADSVITGRQREHSRKPDALQDRIDEVWPDLRKLEVFARRERPGWICAGDDIAKFNEATAA